MTRLRRRVPIGVKIFGIALSMLALLIALSAFTSLRVNQVSQELSEISNYLIPLGAALVEVDRRIHLQAIHFERLLRLYESSPQAPQARQLTRQAFDTQYTSVVAEIQRGADLATKAFDHVHERQDIIALARFELIFEEIEREYREFHALLGQIMTLLDAGEQAQASVVQHRLEQEEEDINRAMAVFVNELATFTQRSARNTEHHERAVLRFSQTLTGFATIAGFFFAATLTLWLMRPVRALMQGTRHIAGGNLDVQVEVASQDEIGDLTTVFNTMVQEIRDKERIQATFGQFLDPRIVDRLMRETGDGQEVGEKQVMTVFVSDIAGFSAISEMLTPVSLVNLINHYLTLAAEPIQRTHGIIDKFIGDAIVAFWGPPFAGATEHAEAACIAALEQAIQIDKLHRRLPDLLGLRRGLPAFHIRIGIATGEVIAGTIGSTAAKSYTIIGHAAGVAASLEGMNKVYGTKILISEDTCILAGDTIETRKIDVISDMSPSGRQPVFELLCRRGELSPQLADLRGVYEEGLTAYWNRNWSLAQAQFTACLQICQDDGPARLLLQRVATLHAHPPDEAWDGVWRAS